MTKCASGLGDEIIDKMQSYDMMKIDRNAAMVPEWLLISKKMVPDFIVKDPKHASVWEISGTKFIRSKFHTAYNISFRYPCVTKI